MSQGGSRPLGVHGQSCHGNQKQEGVGGGGEETFAESLQCCPDCFRVAEPLLKEKHCPGN